jgi:hypothetical protein
MKELRTISSNDELGRTERNDWGKTIEDKIIGLCPKPISYDVDSTQPINFTEYSYTEFMGGIMLNTQNLDINCILMRESSQNKSDIDSLSELSNIFTDKYNLNEIKTSSFPKDVCFFVGQNMFDIMSSENISRLAFENDDFCVKLHPLTSEDSARHVAGFVGWDKILDSQLSGVQLLKNCETAYVSTATELCAAAVMLDKKIVNVSNFFNESSGIYYSINSILFNSKEPKTLLNNMVNDKSSGLLFPWMNDIDERINAYFNKTLKLREIYKPLYKTSGLKKTPVNKIGE